MTLIPTMRRMTETIPAERQLEILSRQVEEIIPEVEHVILLQRGRVMDAGSKASMLTDERLSVLFEAPVHVTENHGYYHLRA